MTEDTSLQSRIASLHYEYYEDKDQLQKDLENKKEEIQCAVGRVDLDGISVFPFGKAQQPALMDYADGVDTDGIFIVDLIALCINCRITYDENYKKRKGT